MIPSLMHAFPSVLFILFYLGVAKASITIYYPQGQTPLNIQTGTTGAAAAAYTGAAAYNPTVLNSPPIPEPQPPTQFNIQLQSGDIPGLSIKQSGAFLGFSIEFSVADQVLGKNGSFLQVPFLNLMANIKERAGRVNVRVGGNTQERATLVDTLPDGKSIEKDKTRVTNPTDTPPLVFTPEILYMMSNISSLTNVRWYLGVPFNDTSNFRLQIAEVGQQILGDYLIGLQVGNEPDLYGRHNNRPQGYGPQDYYNEFGMLVSAMGNDANAKNRNLLIGPNLATGDWTPEMMWDTGFVNTYADNLAALAVEHYPTDNCYAQYGIGMERDPQEVFSEFLNHTAGIAIVAPYLNSANIAQAAGKPLLMFETNTASCGGFAGISDSFGAAMWALDYGLQMAFSNFSGALLHVGGQNVFYNPFTLPGPPSSATDEPVEFPQWSIGPVYYSVLVMAETLGSSNVSQIVDLNANSGNIFTPVYAIYENGTPMRLGLFNYVTDPSGASDYIATIAIGGGTTGQSNATPQQVKVKYLSAASVSQKGNITWAGQTFGSNFGSDGRLQGDEDVQTITCDTTANTCQIKVPAPSYALVFLSDQALEESVPSGSPKTFPTTARTRIHNTATIDGAVLATSNGHRGIIGMEGSTSQGITNGAGGLREGLPGLATISALMVGGYIIATRIWIR